MAGNKNEIRESIVQMAEVEGLEEVYQKLENITGKRFDIPLPHVTLFTNSTNPEKKFRGIGIYSEKQFEELNHLKIL